LADNTGGDQMFHPVPRVDRWEPLVIAGVVVLMVTATALATWLR
jgi:hypothetical protein